MASSARAQDCFHCASPVATPEASNEEAWIIKKQVNEVNVWFTASSHGKVIADLSKDDVTIRDEGDIPAAVVEFRSQYDLPLRVGLLVDTSGSLKDRFHFEQAAATAFLREAIHPQDLGFVMGFANHPALTQDLTNDTTLLSAGVAALKPEGGTALFDAIAIACRKLSSGSEERLLAKLLVVLSDGDDNSSQSRIEDAISVAQHDGVVIYTINTDPTTSDTRLADSHRVADNNMKRLAEQTGGWALRPGSARAVAGAFSKVQQELRCRYAVSYRPPDFVADGRYRRIRIVARRQGKNLQVHARSGYYAGRSSAAIPAAVESQLTWHQGPY